MRIRPTWKSTQIGKRLIASVMCLSMLVTLVPYVHAASDKDTLGTQTGDIQSGEITITQEQSNALMENLFGSEFSAVESADGSYTYQLTQKGSALLVAEMLGDATLSDDTNANVEDVNALPEGYVDDSNEVLYDLLEELNSKPSTWADAGSTGKKVDLFFVIDSTGSMSGAISNVKENVAEFARYMGEKGVTLRIGLIDYKDITADGNDSTVVHTVNFTPWLSVPDFITELTKVSATGGGDGPETPIDALGHLTKDTMGWSSDAYKFAMLITDADYKTNNQHGIADMDDMIQKLQAADIQVSVVTRSTYMDDYGNLAGYTGGIQADLYSDFGPLLQDYADAVIGSTQPMKNYTIVVKEQTTGLPVSGATVSWRGGSTTTDAAGIAVIQARSNVIENLRIECVGYRDNNIGTFTMGESGKGEITLTVDATAEDSAGSVPVVTESMFKDPGKASDTLSGPSIEILGKRFDLLSLDIGLDLGLFDNISISHDPDEKTYSVMIGQKYEGEDPQDDPYWKDDYKKYKSLVQTFSDKSAKDIYNEFRTLRKNNKTKADLVFPMDINIGGYADFSYATGTLQPTGGGIVIGVSTKDITLIDAPFPPAPYVFFRLTFSADAKGNFNLVTIDSTGKVAIGVSMKNIELTPALTGTLNLGVPKLASVGGGVKGSLGIKLDGLPPEELEEILTVDAKLALAFSLKLFGFEFGNEWEWMSHQLYPHTARTMTLAEIRMDDFQPILPKDRPLLMAASLPSNVLEFTASVYEDATPQIVPYNDGYMMVWVDTDPGRSATDHMALYYSIFDGNGWSEPQIISDDDTGDFAPSMVVKSDGTPVVVWQNSKVGSEADTLEDRLANLEICVATYSDDSWITKTISSIAGNAPLAVQAVANNDNVSIYWLENSANSPFFAEGTTSVYKVSVDTELIAVDEPLVSNIEELSVFAAGSIGGTESYAYVCNDNLYVNSNRYSIGSECHSLQVVDGKLYWSDSDGFKSFDGSRIVTEGNSIPSGFTVLSNGEDRIVLMNQLAEDNGSILYASTDSGSAWSGFAPIADYGSTILTTSAVLNEDGSILWATGQVSDVAQESEAGQLVVDTYTPAANVEVAEDAYVSVLQAAPGETVQVMVDLTNKGLQATDSLIAKIGENPYTLMVMDETDPENDIPLTTLGAGESASAYISYVLPADLSSNHTINVDIYNGAEKLGTATATVSGAADLVVSDVAVTRNSDGTATVTATVTNQGSIPATAPTVTLSQESVAVVETLDTGNTMTLSDLAVGASECVTFNVNSASLGATSAYDYKRFTVSASTMATEWLVANNEGSVLLAPLSVESITAEQKSLTLATGTTHKLTYTVSPAGAASTVSFMSSDTSIATVSNEGVITPLKAGTATITVLAVESGKSDKVTVTIEGDAVIGVDSVSVSPESATLKIGESATLTATISPETASNQNVTWETSTGNILSITPNGNTVTVTALAAGEGTVTAVTEDGRYTDSATIIVSDTEVEPEPEPEPEPDSGSSSSSGSTSTNVTANAEVSATITNTTASVSISNSSLLRNVNAALKNSNDPKVKVFVKNIGSATTLKVTLPASALTTLGKAGGSISIESRIATVTLDDTILSAMANTKGTNVVLKVAPVPADNLSTVQAAAVNGAPVYDLTLVCGSDEVNFNGGIATVELPHTLDANQSADGVVVSYLTDDGTLEACSTSYNQSAGIVTFRTDHFSKYVVGYDPTLIWNNTYVDVTSDDWFYDAVQYVAANGMMSGIGSNQFAPAVTTNRAMVVTVLHRLQNTPIPNAANTFQDVADDQWYSDAVLWAAEHEIVGGYGNGQFGPTDSITREQLAVILYNYAVYTGVDTTASFDLSSFTDAEFTSTWAKEAVSWSVSVGLLSGKGNGILDPTGTATRAEVAQMLMNYCTKVA